MATRILRCQPNEIPILASASCRLLQCHRELAVRVANVAADNRIQFCAYLLRTPQPGQSKSMHKARGWPMAKSGPGSLHLLLRPEKNALEMVRSSHPVRIGLTSSYSRFRFFSNDLGPCSAEGKESTCTD